MAKETGRKTGGEPNALSWTKGEKRFFVGAGAAFLLLVLLWSMGSTTVQRWEWCRTCLSNRSTSAWGIGLRGGRPFLAAGTEVNVKPSDLVRVLPGSHVHEWHLESTSTTLFGMGRGMGCNTRYVNPVAYRYALRHPFRDTVAEMVRSGVLAPGDLDAMAALPGRPGPDLLNDARRRALLERAQALLATDLLGPDPVWAEVLSGGEEEEQK